MNNGRDVTLKVNVDDTQVKAAEASLNRLKAAATSTASPGISSFGGKTPDADEEQRRRAAAWLGKELPQASNAATDAISAVTNATAGAAKGLGEASTASGGLASMMESVAGAVGIAGISLAAVAVAALAVVAAYIRLAEAAAAYGAELDKSIRVTGLAASTTAALRLVAEETATSFGTIENAASKFRTTIGQAAAGNTHAIATLKLLGIEMTGVTAAMSNVSGAFETALQTIISMPEGYGRTRAAMALFGDDTVKVQQFLKGLGPNVDDARKRMQDLGLYMSGDGLKASERYQKATADLSAAWEGFKVTLGTPFINAITYAIDKMTSLVVVLKDYIATHSLAFPAGTGVVIPIYTGPQDAAPTDGTPGGATAPGAPGRIDVQAQMAAMREAIDKAGADLDNKLKIIAVHASELQTNFAILVERIFADFRASAQNDDWIQWLRRAIDDAAHDYTTVINQMIAARNKAANLKANIDPLHPESKSARDLRDAQESQADAQDRKKAADWVQKRGEMIAEAEKRNGDKARQAASKMAAEEKKAIVDHLADVAAEVNQTLQLHTAENEMKMFLNQQAFDQGVKSEKEYLAFRKDAAWDDVNLRKWALQQEIDATQQAIDTRGDLEGQLNKKKIALLGQLAVAEKELNNNEDIPALTTEERLREHINLLLTENIDRIKERRSLKATTEEDSLISQITALKDQLANGGVNDQLKIEAAQLQDIVDLRNREVDAVIRINRAQLELSQQMDISNNQIRAGVYEHLAAQKSLNQAMADGINGTYDAIAKQMDTQLDKLNNWSKGMLSFITEPLKAMQHNVLSNVFKNVVDSIFPGMGTEMTKTNNPVARPIVDKLDETNKILKSMGGGLGSGKITGSGGGMFGSLLGMLGLGGSVGGGLNGGGLGGILAGSGGGGSGRSDIAGIMAGLHDMSPSGPGGHSQGILSSIFGKGGIFGAKGFGFNAGTYGAVGGIASMIGGAVGGQLGNIISFAGMGLMLGGPIGAGIGALIGILMGDPKKKADKNENLPKLQQGFSDAMSQLTQILQDIRSMNGDPDALLAKARDVRSQMASGFGVQMASGWGKKESQKLIAQQLATIDREPDGLMAQIIAAAGIARGAADRNKRILPEFAGGTYFADFFRPNGLIPGVFDSRDDMLAMLSRGEMVLNPSQQSNVRARAGFDVFAGAGIPNYSRSASVPKMATGGIINGSLALQAQPMVVQPHFTLELSGVSLDDKVEAYLTSDTGLRTQVQVNKTLKKAGSI